MLAAVLLLLPLSLAATETSVREVEQCVLDNMPERTMRHRVELKIVDRVGQERILDTELEWKRFEGDLARFVMHVTAPADMRGSAFLVIEQADRDSDVFVYMPELRRVKRISMRTAAGTAFGSDFSYEDMQQLRKIVESGERRRLPDAKLEARDVHVIESRRAEGSSGSYERVLSYIDTETCVILRSEMFEKGATLRKLLTIDPAKVQRAGGIWFPTEIAIEDRRKGTRSLMSVRSSEIDVEISDHHFTQTSLERRH
jgi:hypothetical protein